MHKPFVIDITIAIRLTMSFCAAFAITTVLILLLQGKQGLYYDFLNKIAPAPTIAQNIVLIETDSPYDEEEIGIDLELFVSVLLSLIEMHSESLLVQAPISGTNESTLLNTVFSAMTAFGQTVIDDVWRHMSYTDPDGVLRRIQAVIYSQNGEKMEHPVYGILKYGVQIPSYYTILVRAPRDTDFIRIPLSDFINYILLEFDLQRLLWQGDALNMYQNIGIMERPSFLGEYLKSVQNIMLESPKADAPSEAIREWLQVLGQRKQLWLHAKSNYFDSVEKFFFSNKAQELLVDYDRRIEAASEQERAGIQERRKEVEACIVNIRQIYETLIYSGNALQSRLQGSLCIMGPLQKERYPAAFVSAVLANTILTGSVLIECSNIFIVLFSLVCASLMIVLLLRLPPFKIAVFGSLYVFFIFISFSISFVLTSYWIDPFIPTGASTAAGICSLIFTLQAAQK